MKFLLLGVLLSGLAMAEGQGGGNGGGVHVCPGRQQVEMYDLYEGWTRYNVPKPAAGLSVDAYVDRATRALHRFNPAVGLLVQRQVDYLRDDHLLVRANLVLRRINDATILVIDEGCTYEQLANWDNVSGNVLVKKELYDRMDNVSKAALILHEAIYKVARETYQATNSDESRRTVAEAINGERAFTNLSFWIHSFGVRVVDPKPADALATIDATSKAWTLTVHLGEKNFFSTAAELEVNVIYPKVKLVQAEMKKALALKKQELDRLSSEITQAGNRRGGNREATRLTNLRNRVITEHNEIVSRHNAIGERYTEHKTKLENRYILEVFGRRPQGLNTVTNIYNRARPLEEDPKEWSDYEMTVTVKLDDQIEFQDKLTGNTRDITGSTLLKVQFSQDQIP